MYLDKFEKISENKTKALSYLKVEKDSITVLSPCFFILPTSFVESSSEKTVSSIRTICNIDLYFYEDNDKLTKINLPINFYLPINFSEEIADGTETIFKVEANTVLINENFYKNDVLVAHSLFSMILSGKFAEFFKVPYKSLPFLMEKLMNENEIKGHAFLEYELLLQGLCRDIKDKTTSFRKIAKNGVNDKSFKDYQMVNIRDIPRLESPFNAIASENIQDGILSVLNNKEMYDGKKITPLEKIALSKSINSKKESK